MRRLALIAVGSVLAACGGNSTTAPTPAAPHADISDPVGDARNANYPQFTNPPDLLHATVDIAGGNITFSIRLAPGTFDPQSTVLVIDLDTDQSPSTGLLRNGQGVDYSLTMGAPGFGNPPLGNRAWVLKFGAVTPGQFAIISTVPVTVLADGMNVTVPLSLLGTTDGRINFRVESLIQLTTISAAPFDDMPDVGLPPGMVR
jgi:hypothetical protein